MTLSTEAVATAIGVLSALSFLLAAVVLRKYSLHGQGAQLAYGVGLVLVGFTLVQEALFYVGVWSQALIQSYFFLVAVLVGILSLGSARLGLSPAWFRIYAAYVAVMSVLVGLTVFGSTIPESVLDAGVVTGNPSLPAVITSSLVTIPAAVLMVVLSISGAIRKKRWNLLLIAAGIIVISAAGTLYIVSIPVTLYFAEFAGVFLLFLGFLGVPAPASRVVPASAASGK